MTELTQTTPVKYADTIILNPYYPHPGKQDHLFTLALEYVNQCANNPRLRRLDKLCRDYLKAIPTAPSEEREARRNTIINLVNPEGALFKFEETAKHCIISHAGMLRIYKIGTYH